MCLILTLFNFDALSKSNMKIERLRVLYDIKCIILALKRYRFGIYVYFEALTKRNTLM